MTLPVRRQAGYWGIAVAVFLLILWYLGDVMLPFLLGGAIAYFLDPAADRLEATGCSRAAATTIITAAAALAFVLMAFLVIPSMVGQALALIDAAPRLFAELRDALTERFPSLMDEQSAPRRSLDNLGEAIRAGGGAFLSGVMQSALGFINVLALLVITPVVAFYLLLDWDRMVARIDALLPRDHAPVIRQLARDIDATLAAFVRGQGTVCLILGAFYAAALMLIGLSYGLVAGFIAGLLTFIPYVGALVGGALALGLALFQFWGEWWSIAAVAGVFAFGQMLEGNVLTPKLVGASIGLHPVWLIFALSAFGALFGFVGVLVAVPVAAALGVLARFLVGQYTQGPLYRGGAGDDAGDGDDPGG